MADDNVVKLVVKPRVEMIHACGKCGCQVWLIMADGYFKCNACSNTLLLDELVEIFKEDE